MKKNILLSITALLFSGSVFASGNYPLVCEAEGSSISINVEEGVLLSTLKNDIKTVKFERKLSQEELHRVENGSDWTLILSNDIMETLVISNSHYDDEMAFIYNSHAGPETFKSSNCVRP